ncbi:MAG: hypothetical protein RID53_32335 [Coleofasciculus sp. B1-GNL1-01]
MPLTFTPTNGLAAALGHSCGNNLGFSGSLAATNLQDYPDRG